jgi:hypothetical protein
MATRLAELDVDLTTRRHRERGLDRLSEEFAGTFSPETVERFMAESLQGLAGTQMQNFLPLLVYRLAHERCARSGKCRARSPRTSQRCCSCACTTRAAARWPPHRSTTWARAASTRARPAATRPTRATRAS